MLVSEIGLEFLGSVRTKSTEKYKHNNMFILYLELARTKKSNSALDKN